MSNSNIVKPLVLDWIPGNLINLITWTPLVRGGITEPCIMMRITNAYSDDVFISYDGSHIHEFIPAGKSILVNFQTNSSPNNDIAKISKGTIVYAQGNPKKDGYVFVAGYYNVTNE